jgi:hypothetical protein
MHLTRLLGLTEGIEAFISTRDSPVIKLLPAIFSPRLPLPPLFATLPHFAQFISLANPTCMTRAEDEKFYFDMKF